MEKHWYLIYTKPRNEKKVAERLEKEGYTVYCPLVKSLRKWSDRKKKVQIPLFTSYVFIYMEEREHETVTRDPGVLFFIFWLGKLAIVKDCEIAAIREITANAEDIKVSALQVKKGQMIRIKEGLFKGLHGKIINVSKNIVIIYIEQLGCQIQFKYSRQNLIIQE